jgi:hypothetical protein
MTPAFKLSITTVTVTPPKWRKAFSRQRMKLSLGFFADFGGIVLGRLRGHDT